MKFSTVPKNQNGIIHMKTLIKEPCTGSHSWQWMTAYGR